MNEYEQLLEDIKNSLDAQKQKKKTETEELLIKLGNKYGMDDYFAILKSLGIANSLVKRRPRR
jgi:hypothetical protein